MPLYLCKPGWSQSEPWRHGLQVYASPFRMEEDVGSMLSSSNNNNSNSSVAVSSRAVIARNDENNVEEETVVHTTMEHRDQEESSAMGRYKDSTSIRSSYNYNRGMPIRRVRHAELILVDEVCSQYGRYWLRLRWPGVQGGFAGYIALGRVNSTNISRSVPSLPDEESLNVDDANLNRGDGDVNRDESNKNVVDNESDRDDKKRSFLRCLTSGICYPTSSAMELLYAYDDGISNGDDGSVKSKASNRSGLLGSNDYGEPVFCRICREGLHDISDPTNPATNNLDSSPSPPTSSGSIQETFQRMSHPSAENPLLSPCDCTGSIAFVHYLCIEQWRCRSRHPAARNGLNCETCGSAYTLPPPPIRPVTDRPQDQNMGGPLEEDNWLEAMPAHVLAALRRPHVWWAFGAAIVRRKYLRPLAPMIMSPLVALYCRARRMLKKRGVSRRRWSCSLCRRRARWKCVRCLRSYYCSRQCQNVSWHIVHKHVCYKPARFFSSCVFYTLLALVSIPGIWSHPLLYALGFASLPLCFIIMGIIGGGLASTFKHIWKIDVRGRMLELGVVFSTLRMASISWGIIQGFFMNTHTTCTGTFSRLRDTPSSIQPYESAIVNVSKHFFFLPLHYLFTTFDSILYHSRIPFICHSDSYIHCFASIQTINPNFMHYPLDGMKCFYDILSISYTVIIAFSIILFGALLRKHRHHEGRNHREHRHRAVRDDRRVGFAQFAPRRMIFVDQAAGPNLQRPHQD